MESRHAGGGAEMMMNGVNNDEVRLASILDFSVKECSDVNSDVKRQGRSQNGQCFVVFHLDEMLKFVVFYL